MINQLIQDEFDVRFYRWSLADAERELDQDLPLLRTVKGISASANLQYLETLTPEERQSFMLASVKNANNRALQLLGESLTRDEQDLLTHYRNNIMPLVGSFIEKLFEARFAPDKTKRPRKRRLARLVDERLRPYCGDIEFRESTYLWTHMTEVEGWEVRTQIDMGGSADLCYWHAIYQPGDTFLKYMISLHQWLGLPNTEWSIVSESEETSVADSIETLCRHFLNAATTLLKDLPADNL